MNVYSKKLKWDGYKKQKKTDIWFASSNKYETWNKIFIQRF